MKKIFYFLCILLLPFCSKSAYGYDFECDGKYYNILSMQDNTLALTYGETNYTGNLMIPDTVEFRERKFTVTHIGAFAIKEPLDTFRIPATVVAIDDNAFSKKSEYSTEKYCDHIRYLDIADSETSLKIGSVEHDGMFRDCRVDHLYAGRMLNYKREIELRRGLGKVTLGKYIHRLTKDFVPYTLTSYEIPTQITFLEDGAFSECRKLTSITGVERMGWIGNEVFSGCESLKSITLPKDLSTLSAHLFEDCQSLTQIDIPESVWNIEDYVFLGCNHLQRIVIPQSVKKIGLRTFYGCSQLKEVVLPSTLESIGFQAFCFCFALEHLSIPSTVNAIDGEAFASCTTLKSIVLPEGITRLPRRLFVSCDSLKQCLIPSTVSQIDEEVFSGCQSLASITLPASVRDLKRRTFSGCMRLKTIRMENPTPVHLYKDAFNKGHYLDSELQVPVGAKAAYQSAEGWMNFWNITEYHASDALRLMITCPAKGCVVIGNDTISNETYAKDYSAVEEVELKILPDEGYGIQRVTINDEEVTERVKDHCLTVKVDGVLNIQVAFYHRLLVLDDAIDTYYHLETEMLEKVVYNRQFDDTDWQALYLPFAMDYDDWCTVVDIAGIHDTHQYDDNHDGKVDRTTLEAFQLQEGSSTEPNTPYLVRAKAVGPLSLVKQNATLAPSVVSGFDCSSVSTYFVFNGTYNKLLGEFMDDNYYYTMQNGVLTQATLSTTLNGFRWWMKAMPRNGRQWLAPRMIEIDIVDNVTGIESTVSQSGNAGINVFDVYNLQGKLVKQAATNLDGLAKGIYIIGGKKVIK